MRLALSPLYILLSLFLLQPANGAEHDHGQHGMHAVSWTEQPILLAQQKGRNSKIVRLINGQADQVTVFASSVQENGILHKNWRVSKNGEGFSISAKNGVGGYHWLAVRQVSGKMVRVASTMIYFSMPAPAPTTMLQQPKNSLEIVPHPMPREHGHYRAGETWPFLLRFDGHPLANTTLSLQSEQGGAFAAISNHQGIAMITFPQEFIINPPPATTKTPKQQESHHQRPKANFVLTANHSAEGKQYQTAFNHDYRPGPFYNKSLLTGFGFMFLGMLMATPLLRKTKTERGST